MYFEYLLEGIVDVRSDENIPKVTSREPQKNQNVSFNDNPPRQRPRRKREQERGKEYLNLNRVE